MVVALFGKKKEKAKVGTALKTYLKVYKDGVQAFKNGDDEKAILSFRKLLRWVTEDADKISKLSSEEKKKLSEMLTKAGEAMIRLKEYDSAIKLLEKAKTIDPSNFRAWMDIGRDLIQRNTQIPYALVCLREAAKLKPDDVEVHMLLGDAYRTQGQDEKALKEYREVLRIDPENEDALEKILKIQPENVEILEKYVRILEKKGKKDDLLKAYNRMFSLTGDTKYLEKGLEIDPENKDLLMQKARYLIRNDKLDEARSIIEKLLQKYPEDPDIEMLAEEIKPEEKVVVEEEVKPIEVEELFGDIGLEDLMMEEHAPEKEVMEESGESEITTPEVEEEKMSSLEEFKNYLSSGNIDSAMSLIDSLTDEEILSLLDESEDVIKSLISILQERKRYDLAEKFANRLREMNSSDENLLIQSRILIEAGKISDAENVLNELLKRNMKNGYALYEKAKIMAVKGNEMGARNFLMMATRFIPELKEFALKDKYFENYRDRDWFKKMVS